MRVNANGRLATITYPSGRVLVHADDAAGNLTGITTDSGVAFSVTARQPFGGPRVLGDSRGNSQTRTHDL